MNSNPKQTARILDYLREHGSITQMEALNELGVFRLAPRISEMREGGCKINSELIKVENRW